MIHDDHALDLRVVSLRCISICRNWHTYSVRWLCKSTGNRSLRKSLSSRVPDPACSIYRADRGRDGWLSPPVGQRIGPASFTIIGLYCREAC